MNYVVAWMNFFDNDLKMISVEAGNPITAMVEGARQLMGNNPENNMWLDPMLQNIPEPEDYAARIEEIREEFFNTNQVIAVMLPLTGETYR